MKLIGMVAATALGLAGAANAQTTDCTSPGAGMVHCQTMAPPPAAWNAYVPPVPSGPTGDPITGLIRYARMKHVGSLIATGHCLDAENYALNAGDFELAGEAHIICKSRAPK